jgi:ATP-dependent DNA ligase
LPSICWPSPDTTSGNAPLAQRRELLEQLAVGWEPPLNLSPITRDRAQALAWFEDLHHAGLEGLVVKALPGRAIREALAPVV